MKRTDKRKMMKEFVILTFGAVLAAAAIYFFMLPSHVAVGSASALGMVISNFIPLPVSAITLIINIFLLIVGFLLIGPEFGIKTVYTAIMVPVSMGAFERIFPNFQSLTQDPLLDVMCYILVVGMAMAILFSCNASSGGLDIVAKIMNKYLHMELGRASGVAGIVVALSSALCYDTKIVVLSILGTYFGGMIVDHFIFGLNPKKRVCIISEKEPEILDYILNTLQSGASLVETIGAYTGNTFREIITIVDKTEYRTLMTYLEKVDPDAFVTIYSVHEVHYRPKPRRQKVSKLK
jgi:uncharacterized membrane-anchored protein YitT (DUF2179 family)